MKAKDYFESRWAQDKQSLPYWKYLWCRYRLAPFFWLYKKYYRIKINWQGDRLSNILQAIYDNEINLTIGWFWDGGIDVVIGDKLNGIQEQENFDTVEQARNYLEEFLAGRPQRSSD